MEYICEVKYAEILNEWAKREYGTVDKLRFHRSPILDRLPPDTKWFRVKILREDLPSLKLINDLSWNDLSNSTGNIKTAADNFDRFSKSPLKLPHQVLPSGITRQQYFDRLMKKLGKFRAGAGNLKHNLTLTLISSTKTGPFTILEGNNTAMALHFRYFVDHSNLPYPDHCAYVGISPKMIYYLFYHTS